MKQFERKITITYRWWTDSDEEINPKDISRLDEEAKLTVAEMMELGFTSGELNLDVTPNKIDYSSYSGHWEMNTETL